MTEAAVEHALRNDLDRVRASPREHWHVSLFICAVVSLVAVTLVHWGLVSARAGVAAGLAGVLYVLLTTWFAARRRPDDLQSPSADKHDQR